VLGIKEDLAFYEEKQAFSVETGVRLAALPAWLMP
jgi:hypothetical protein